uniref:Uncharacterized protein n=1 Tax=Plectus sambesii TaxID=2011161 RepID=A0A914V6I1_9BILA
MNERTNGDERLTTGGLQGRRQQSTQGSSSSAKHSRRKGGCGWTGRRSATGQRGRGQQAQARGDETVVVVVVGPEGKKGKETSASRWFVARIDRPPKSRSVRCDSEGERWRPGGTPARLSGDRRPVKAATNRPSTGLLPTSHFPLPTSCPPNPITDRTSSRSASLGKFLLALICPSRAQIVQAQSLCRMCSESIRPRLGTRRRQVAHPSSSSAPTGESVNRHGRKYVRHAKTSHSVVVVLWSRRASLADIIGDSRGCAIERTNIGYVIYITKQACKVMRN